jgi:hypothetical protein
MGIDVNLLRNKLNKLQNTKKKSDLLWKPQPGTYQVRIVPYKFRPDNPFIELYFHYNVNNKTYLSPISFGDADPIAEFAEKLKNTGDKDDWKTGKNMEPKLRTFLPIIERGKEQEGVKFWGFGKTVYQDLLAYIADPDYGDITDPVSGRDITIEYISAAESGKSFPTTNIRVKPKETKMVEDINLAKKLVEEQSEITEVYSVLSYDELKSVLERWLSGEDEPETTTNTVDESSNEEPAVSQELSKTEVASEPKSTTTVDEVDAAFSALFDKKK